MARYNHKDGPDEPDWVRRQTISYFKFVYQNDAMRQFESATVALMGIGSLPAYLEFGGSYAVRWVPPTPRCYLIGYPRRTALKV